MKSLAFRQQIRIYELEQVLPFMPAGCSILEIGAGAGWQAKVLADKGFQVTAIDIASSRYRADQIWPVIDYDGEQIPFPDHSFDVVFSSNTLEHIPHVVTFMDEVGRVLKPGGVAIHVMPSGVWRFWTMVTHYAYLPYYLKKGTRSVLARARAADVGIVKILGEELYELFVPSRHGERGTVVTELYLFSRPAWLALFQKSHWKVAQAYPNRLFYTGHGFFGGRLGIKSRRRLSSLLGSACNIFVLEPNAVNVKQSIQKDTQSAYALP
jgi:SAM-dependent methyltransferase